MASVFENEYYQQGISIYTIDISGKWGPEYVSYINDVVRMVLLQVTLQFMFYMIDSEKYCFFTEDFGITLLFIILGVSVYWLVFKKFIIFK